MRPIEITFLDVPERHPNATTGDPAPRQPVVVCWPGDPDEYDLREFDERHPSHLFDVTHWPNFRLMADEEIDAEIAFLEN